VFSQLVVWVDANHNGISEAGELKSLASVGIQAIHLEVHQSRRTDEYGNTFRYRVKLDANGSVGKWAVDVYLGSHPVGVCANPSAPTQQQ
jgi:trimeric autotransporter adhesin